MDNEHQSNKINIPKHTEKLICQRLKTQKEIHLRSKKRPSECYVMCSNFAKNLPSLQTTL